MAKGRKRVKDEYKDARKKAEELGIGRYERHVFICIGPDCCSEKEGQAAWDRLKKRVGELNSRKDGAPGCQVYRSKVGCLRICKDGPVGVVYPDGTWYAGLDPDAIDELVDEHLRHGRPLTDHIIANNPLPNSGGRVSAVEE